MADNNEDLEQAQPTDQQPEEQRHWTEIAAEQIRYGDDEQARDALLNVVRSTFHHERNLAQIAECDREEKEIILRFEKANPSIAKDSMLSAATRQYLIDRQREELESLGVYDPKQHATATADQIMAAHKTFRAAKDSRATSAEHLLQDAVNEIEGRFGVRSPPGRY